MDEYACSSSWKKATADRPQTLVAPLAAATMACLLFFYSRTSIHAARLNAQKHREADGGQLNWRNESLRRHGQLDKIDDRSLLKEALIGNKEGSSETMDAKVEEMRRKAPGDADSTKMLEQIKSRGKRSRKEGD